MDWYVHPSINASAITGLFARMQENGLELHTLQIARGDQTLVRVSAEPYACTDIRENYSLSKLFTSTVVGIAVDRGYVREDDRIVDIFGRKDASERMSRMTLRNVISMNTGHDHCLISDMIGAEDSVEAFFAVEPRFEPGTHFTYNTGASCLLTSVVEKVTGQKFFDFACENLFFPMGITDVHWRFCEDGKCVGGSGLYASSDDILKLGRMYAAGGIFEGKRILSERWIRNASAFVSDNGPGPNPDWSSGYGYQIWINSRDGFRGDGAFGQLCMILPKHDLVLAMQGFCGDMQKEIDLVSDFLEELEKPSLAPALPMRHEPSVKPNPLPTLCGTWRLEPNAFGFTTVQVDSAPEKLTLSFCDSRSIQRICAVPGQWVTNCVQMRHMQPCLSSHLPHETAEPLVIEAACGSSENGFTLDVRYRTSPHSEVWDLSLRDDVLTLRFLGESANLRPENARFLTGHRL